MHCIFMSIVSEGVPDYQRIAQPYSLKNIYSYSIVRASISEKMLILRKMRIDVSWRNLVIKKNPVVNFVHDNVCLH
jgi:hypothetical protein